MTLRNDFEFALIESANEDVEQGRNHIIKNAIATLLLSTPSADYDIDTMRQLASEYDIQVTITRRQKT